MMVEAQLPKPEGVVTDLAGLLDPSAKSAAESVIADVERKTTAEIALVTVESLHGMTVEDYTSRLFSDWGIGQKTSNNGVL